MASVAKLLERAVLHEKAGELQASEDVLRSVIRKDPEHRDALHLMGGVILKQQRPADALAFLNRSLEQGCQTVSLLSNLGATYRQLNRNEEAIAYYRKATELDPSYAPAYFNIGILHEMKGELNQAFQAYKSTITHDPNFAAAHNNIANMLAQQAGQQEAVLHHQREAVRLKPQHSGFQNSLARTLHAAGQHEEALKYFQAASELNSQDANALIDYGVALNQADRIEEAVEVLEKALLLDPANEAGQYNVGKIYQNAKNPKEAVAKYRIVLKTNPNNLKALLDLGKCERDLENFAESEEALKRLISLTPDSKVANFNLGHTYFSQNRLEEAITYFKTAIKLDNKYHQAWYVLSKIYISQGEYADACATLNQVCLCKPKDIDCRFMLAKCHELNNQPQEAVHRFLQVLNLDDTNTKTWFELGNLWNKLEFSDKALNCYQKVIALFPEHAAAHCNIAEINRGIGNLELANEHFDLSIEISSDPLTRIKKAILLKPICDTHAEINEARQQLEQSLDELLADGVSSPPNSQLSPTLFFLAYHGLDDRTLAEKYAKLFKPTPEFSPSSKVATPHKDGKIHLGFISHNFKSHTIGNLTNGLLKEIDKDKFHVTVFTQIKYDDWLGEVFQNESDEYVVLGANLSKAVSTIQEHNVDLLFYPDLGMDPYTLSLSKLRLAPVQCVSWGHPVTSGSAEMDYYISTELIDTEDAQQYFTEELVQFKTLPTYFYNPPTPEIYNTRTELGIPETGNLYVCPQSLFKFHPDLDVVFCGILERDPNGYIILLKGAESLWTDTLLSRYKTTVPNDNDRILFIDRLEHNKYMSLINLTDVMLDPLHFGGGNTSYQALALGVPIVTCPPVHQRGRFTQGLYRKIGVMDCVVDTVEEYIDLCVELGTNPEKRNRLQEKILSASGILFEERAAVTEFEEFFERVVQEARQE